MRKTAIKETSFSLAFGIEAMVLVKVGLPSYRVEHYHAGDNKEMVRYELKIIEEKREMA